MKAVESMDLVACTRCGSRELVDEGSNIVCPYCQSRFMPRGADVPRPGAGVGIHQDVQALLRKCRDEPANARRYANLILDIDPTNRDAARYLL